MNKPPTVRTNTIAFAITDPSSLGYCCEWLFFQLYRRNSQIADRLGMAERSVREHRAAAEEAGCASCPRCMKAILDPSSAAGISARRTTAALPVSPRRRR